MLEAEPRGHAGPDELVKALVRHGADPGFALAGALVVPAENIRVKDGGE
jgi:hypothetical protein